MLGIELRQIKIIAAKEFWGRIRNRWVLSVALVFTLFALSIAYFGAAQQGTVGFRGIEVTIASLVSLVIYLIPLIALILGYDAIVGERERGSLDLLLSMPITRLELLLGKFFGLSAALGFSTLIGFGSVGLLLAYKLNAVSLLHYGRFMLSAILMGMAFLSMAVMVSVIATERIRASGIAISLWFFFVLIFDLLLLAVLVTGGGKIGTDVLPFLLFLNPADIFRILNIFSSEDARAFYGLSTIMPNMLTNAGLLCTAMVFWIVAPLGVALWRFK